MPPLGFAFETDRKITISQDLEQQGLGRKSLEQGKP